MAHYWKRNGDVKAKTALSLGFKTDAFWQQGLWQPYTKRCPLARNKIEPVAVDNQRQCNLYNPEPLHQKIGVSTITAPLPRTKRLPAEGARPSFAVTIGREPYGNWNRFSSVGEPNDCCNHPSNEPLSALNTCRPNPLAFMQTVVQRFDFIGQAVESRAEYASIYWFA